MLIVVINVNNVIKNASCVSKMMQMLVYLVILNKRVEFKIWMAIVSVMKGTLKIIRSKYVRSARMLSVSLVWRMEIVLNVKTQIWQEVSASLERLVIFLCWKKERLWGFRSVMLDVVYAKVVTISVRNANMVLTGIWPLLALVKLGIMIIGVLVWIVFSVLYIAKIGN